MDKCKNTVLQQLTATYRSLLQPVSFEGLEEIRFRINRPVMLYAQRGIRYVSRSGGSTEEVNHAKIAGRAEMNALAAALCENSVYAHLNDIKDGFITLRGGHRAGLAGKAVMKDGQPAGLTDISGINLRIARPYTGCAEAIAPSLLQNGTVLNTLLISPPQCGKTTLLRDLARILSVNFKIAIVDERSEIAGSYEGVPQFDLGPQTDVLDRFPKSVGMLLAVRSLSPQILITDELGTAADMEALRHAACTGCRLIASIHGDDAEGLRRTHPQLLTLFDTALILGRRNNRPAIMQMKELNAIHA